MAHGCGVSKTITFLVADTITYHRVNKSWRHIRNGSLLLQELPFSESQKFAANADFVTVLVPFPSGKYLSLNSVTWSKVRRLGSRWYIHSIGKGRSFGSLVNIFVNVTVIWSSMINITVYFSPFPVTTFWRLLMTETNSLVNIVVGTLGEVLL